jgi:hypothetical protein
VGGSAFKVLINKGVHQLDGAKCGLYSLTYILRRLDGTKFFFAFSEGLRIDDEELVPRCHMGALAHVAATLFK